MFDYEVGLFKSTMTTTVAARFVLLFEHLSLIYSLPCFKRFLGIVIVRDILFLFVVLVSGAFYPRKAIRCYTFLFYIL